MTIDLYEQDFYAWTQDQAAKLRAGELTALDLAHLAEEIESMGRSERRELINRLAVLLAHLLKWAYQSERRSKSWRNTVRVQRLDAGRILKDNPSLKPQAADILSAAYEKARLLAAADTGLDEETFPAQCPWTLEQALDNDYWPE